MFKSNKWWLLTSLVVLGLALAACSPATVEPTEVPPTATPVEKIQIGLFVPVSGNTYEEARLRGAQEAAAKLNAEVVNFAGDYDALKQINQIQDAIASKNFDALLIHPIDSNAVVPVVEDALKAGLVVVGADSPIGPNPDSLEPYPEGVVAFIGRTGKATGEWLGQAVIKACEGKDPCEVAYLIGMQNLTIDQVRYQNLQDTIKPYPNIKIVAFQEALYRNMKKRKADVLNHGVKRAPFMVLLGVDMPAVLVEVACLSNEAEENHLKDPAYREGIARYIETGIIRYLHDDLKRSQAS